MYSRAITCLCVGAGTGNFEYKIYLSYVATASVKVKHHSTGDLASVTLNDAMYNLINDFYEIIHGITF